MANIPAYIPLVNGNTADATQVMTNLNSIRNVYNTHDTLQTNVMTQMAPIGSVVDYAGSAAPTGWFLCYGQSLSTTTYAALYTIIGTTYGTVGAGFFNLPDCRGRVGAGKDDMGGASANRLTVAGCGFDGDVLGAVGGNELTGTHGHANTITGGVFTSSGTSSTHTHQLPTYGSTGTAGRVAASANTPAVNTVTSGTETANHTHTTTVTITGGVTDFTGGNSGNVQPTIVFNKIIRYI